jgi:histidine phosphotransferase ChpT
MDHKLDSRITELLCARLCHDLISPVAAINNGIELVTEFDDDMHDEAMSLIGESSKKASEQLQFFRIALGSAQAVDGAGIGLLEARQRVIRALGSERIEIDWQENPEMGTVPVSKTDVKLMLNMIWLGVEVLPGAGKVTINVAMDAPERNVEVVVFKEGFSLPKAFEEALELDVGVETLTPRTIQAHYTRVLADMNGSNFVVATKPGTVSFKANLASAV